MAALMAREICEGVEQGASTVSRDAVSNATKRVGTMASELNIENMGQMAQAMVKSKFGTLW
jgi:hypothetical protein